MEAGTLPPNWQDLIKHSSEKAATEDLFKADTWLSVQQIVDSTDQLTDLFAIVPDQRKNQQPQRRAAHKQTWKNIYGCISQLDSKSMVYATDISSNNSFTFRNAMKQDDKLAFVDATEKEISNHEKGGNWSIVNRDTLPNKAHPIKAIWSFKREIKPDGKLLKHKARLCAHGGMQQWGDSYWETYSPVVKMLSVRLILAIAKLHNLDSKAIDFVLALPQAYLEEDIWMYLLIGFQVDGHTEAECL